MLTCVDLQLIRRQCELQEATSPSEIAAFTAAYKFAKEFGNSVKSISLTPEIVLGLAKRLVSLSVPETGGRYRQIPATFRNGTSATNWKLIPREMDNWSEAVAQHRLDPVAAYTEFEKIHPFMDGNGRVGDLLWKILMKALTGMWPQILPPDVFRERDS